MPRVSLLKTVKRNLQGGLEPLALVGRASFVFVRRLTSKLLGKLCQNTTKFNLVESCQRGGGGNRKSQGLWDDLSATLRTDYCRGTSSVPLLFRSLGCAGERGLRLQVLWECKGLSPYVCYPNLFLNSYLLPCEI